MLYQVDSKKMEKTGLSVTEGGVLSAAVAVSPGWGNASVTICLYDQGPLPHSRGPDVPTVVSGTKPEVTESLPMTTKT